jgi:hypothetical protein
MQVPGCILNFRGMGSIIKLVKVNAYGKISCLDNPFPVFYQSKIALSLKDRGLGYEAGDGIDKIPSVTKGLKT